MEVIDRITYLKAKHRVEQIKSFYTHILVYAVVNLFIITAKILNNLSNGETFEQAFYDLSTFMVAMIWGIFVLMHIFYVFVLPFLLGKNWEINKIEALMNDELQNDVN
ncbi:2TM domain-containing protein [Paucihalobacter sp.]|uniref:2TM domain-containing protein n=1 Tax=Paucihalobacter sp. TaxID=2850405 RepID=UPI002FDF362E